MHTPLTLSTTCDHRPAIADARGINIASWDLATIELFDDVRPDIVWAVNSCEAMREALQETQRVLQTFNYDFVKEQFYKNAEVLKALALAEGKESL